MCAAFSKILKNISRHFFLWPICPLPQKAIDILVNLDGEYCQVKYSMFGEKENKKLKALDVRNKL
jgi:hypothetical protein